MLNAIAHRLGVLHTVVSHAPLARKVDAAPCSSKEKCALGSGDWGQLPQVREAPARAWCRRRGCSRSSTPAAVAARQGWSVCSLEEATTWSNSKSEVDRLPPTLPPQAFTTALAVTFKDQNRAI